MNIKNNYNHLYNFIASWFPDADFDDLSDRDIVISFRKVSSIDTVNSIINEISSLIIDSESSIKEISQCANIHFNDEMELITWLSQIKTYLKE